MLRAAPHGHGRPPNLAGGVLQMGLVLVAGSCSHHRNQGCSAKSGTEGTVLCACFSHQQGADPGPSPWCREHKAAHPTRVVVWDLVSAGGAV